MIQSTPVVQGGAEPASDARLLADRYLLERVIGSGGMGVVWQARHTATGRRVAVKLLRTPAYATGRATLPADVAGRFLREARATARVRHPHVVEVLDVGRDVERAELFIVYELLEGETLRALLDRRGRLTLDEAAELLLPVLDGLAAAHRESVLHRDLKPENVMLAREPDDRVVPRLIDFGVARFDDPEHEALTLTGATLGTAHYMSPEQARGARDLDVRSDVWAAGVLWFEALTGGLPYAGVGYNEVLAKILTAPPPRLASALPDAPRSLAAAIDKALAHDRDARHPTVDAFADALRAALRSTAPPRAWGASARRAVLAGCAAALVAGLALTAWSARPPGTSAEARVAPRPSAALRPATARARATAASEAPSSAAVASPPAAATTGRVAFSTAAPAVAPRARRALSAPRLSIARRNEVGRALPSGPSPVNGALVLDP